MKTHALTPTEADIDGATNLSAKSFPVDPSWRCPACGRSQRECVYSGRKGDWRFQVVMHHDHSGRRFEPVAICDDCNQVDARIKNYIRRRRIDLGSKDWSLTVDEIRMVTKPAPHKEPEIDFDSAINIVRQTLT